MNVEFVHADQPLASAERVDRIWALGSGHRADLATDGVRRPGVRIPVLSRAASSPSPAMRSRPHRGFHEMASRGGLESRSSHAPATGWAGRSIVAGLDQIVRPKPATRESIYVEWCPCSLLNRPLPAGVSHCSAARLCVQPRRGRARRLDRLSAAWNSEPLAEGDFRPVRRRPCSELFPVRQWPPEGRPAQERRRRSSLPWPRSPSRAKPAWHRRARA